MTPETALALAGSAALALAVGWAAWAFGWLVTSEREDATGTDDSGRDHRAALRAGSLAYRWFEPLVDELAVLNVGRFPQLVTRLDAALPLTSPLPWMGAGFLAVKQVEGVMAFFAGFALGLIAFDAPIALFLGLLATAVTPYVVVRGVLAKAERYRITIRNRLPYTIDLMALMVESGATIRECLATARVENAGHPIGDELMRVWVLIDNGRPQADALRAMADRVGQSDVTELVNTVNAASERGFELRDVLRRMAEVLRTRRVQYMEQESERAKVQITWPGMVIMVACLLIVVAVFVLPAVGSK
jgi:Flp pilus assembly protein TadB